MQKSDRPRTPRKVTGKWLALGLALLVQLGFVAVLVFTVHWQNRKPEPVTAELYAPPTKAPAVETATPPAPPPAPQPAPQPAPPKPAAVPPPEPKAATPDPHAADIALRARAEEERKKAAEAKRKDDEKKARAQQEAEDRRTLDEKKKQDEKAAEKQSEARARQQRETEAMRIQAEREGETRAKADRDAQARAQQNAQRDKADADWKRSIQAKVRGNVIVPPDIAGNPEAIFEVVQLPTGEIIDVQLRKSSGVRAYDDAVSRAILKSSPLPRPERPDIFQRSLTFRFRPLPE